MGSNFSSQERINERRVKAFVKADLFLDYLSRKKERQFRFRDTMTST